MTGRRPKPTALKALAGNPGGRKLNKREPKPLARAPDCPEWLDDEARGEWERMAPELERLKVLTSIDGAAFASYCELFSLSIQLSRQIRKLGGNFVVMKVTVDGSGEEHVEPKAHPLIAQKRQMTQQLRSYLVEFGLTPSSRSRVITPGADEEDPFEEFEVIQGGKGKRT